MKLYLTNLLIILRLQFLKTLCIYLLKMFKKDNDISVKKGLSQCTLCQHLSSKTLVYVCDSGHVLCGNCHTNSMQGVQLNDACDCLKCKRKKNHKEKKQTDLKFRSHKIDLASGDFAKNTTRSKFENKDDETCLIQDTKNKTDVIVTYANELYQESDTSAGSNENSSERVKVLQEYKPVPRPLTCPVCAKMIAVDSILQHFFFDHSKVSRCSLKLQTSHHTLLKVSDLAKETNCLAIILLDSEKSTVSSPLLLMATQMRPASKRDRRIGKHKDSLTNSNIQNTKSTTVCSKNTESNERVTGNAGNEFKENGTDLIMWLCKTVETDVIYNITLSREDKKMSFSYTGDATHIRDEQNGINMFNKSECVIVKSAAVKKLVNHIGYLHVFVRILYVS